MPTPAEDISLWVKVPVREGGWPREHHHALGSKKHCRTCAMPILKALSITVDWGSKGNPDDIDRFCSGKCAAEHIINLETLEEIVVPEGPMALPAWVWERTDG